MRLLLSALAKHGVASVAEAEQMPFGDVLAYHLTLEQQLDREREAIENQQS